MVVTPNSRIRLLKCPIELDNKNQLTFSSETNQRNYFLSLPYLEEDNCSYQRKDGVIRYKTEPNGLTYEDLLQYNYCMYQNTSYSGKWFYAFIDKINYINDGTTDITIKTDVIQTWKFEINYQPSFVEREMIVTDTRGANVIPEGLETGEYVADFVSEFGIGNSHIVMASNINPSDNSASGGGIYGNIFSGVGYYIFSGIDKLQNALVSMAAAGKIDGITSLFYCPDFITDYASATFDSNGIAQVPNRQGVATSIMVPLTPSSINGYVPRNQKLFTYPYVAYVLSNNSGGTMTYHLEDFYNSGNNLGEIKVRGTCTPGASIRAIPINYRCTPDALGNNDNNEYGLTLGKFPTCSFPVDSYLNWQTQQSVNIGLEVAQSTMNAATNVAVGNYMGAANNLSGIFNVVAEQYKHSLVPVQARGNLNSGDVSYTEGKLTFTGYMMNIKAQFARCIDDYFTMYGYKTNRVKVPNINSRSNWNYVKTIGINITGDIPQEDMQQIKDIFDSGVTLWHNPSTFLDYSQSNN